MGKTIKNKVYDFMSDNEDYIFNYQDLCSVLSLSYKQVTRAVQTLLGEKKVRKYKYKVSVDDDDRKDTIHFIYFGTEVEKIAY